MKSFINKNVALIIVLVLTVILNLYYLPLKSGYFVDEGMTLYLANGNYTGAVTSKADGTLSDFLKEFVIKDSIGNTVTNLFSMMKQVTGGGNYSEEGTVEWYDAARRMLQGQKVWMTGEELFDQLTATGNSRFQYLQIYLNQAMDVHPPLYYFVVNTVFSIFSHSFHNAYLFAINMVALLIAEIFLYKIAMIIWNRKDIALFSTAIFGFSQGFISCAMYFRMYAIFTMFATLTIYLHLLMKEENFIGYKKYVRVLTLIVILGFYTHYYYIVFLFPIFMTNVIGMIKKQQKEKIYFYIKHMILAGIISLVIWPFSAYHILFGYRGTQAVEGLLQGGLLTNFKYYVRIISNAFFFGRSIVLGTFIIVGMIVLFKDREGKVYLELLLEALFYLLIVSKVAPAISDRYIMCLFPTIALLVGGVIVKLLSILIQDNRIQQLMILFLGVVILIGGYTCITPNYLYLEQKGKELPEQLGEISELNGLLIGDDDYRGYPVELKLARFNQCMVIGEDEIDILGENQPKDLQRDIVIYIFDELDQNKVIKRVCDLLECDGSIEKIDSDIMEFQAYLVKAEG